MPLDPLVTSGIIAAGASLLSSGMGITSGKLNFRQTRNLMSYQNQLNQQNWAMNNEYNAPLNQRSRLLEAGISPNQIDGSSIATADAPSASLGSSPGTDLSGVAPAALSGFQADADRNEKVENAKFTASQRERSEQLHKGVMEIQGREIKLKDAGIKQADLDSKKTVIEIEEIDNRIEALNESLAQRWYELDLKQQEVATGRFLAYVQNKLVDGTVSRYQAQTAIDWYNATTNRNLSLSQIRKNNADAADTEFELGVKQRTFYEDRVKSDNLDAIQQGFTKGQILDEELEGQRLSNKREKYAQGNFEFDSPGSFLRSVYGLYRGAINSIVGPIAGAAVRK